MRPSWVVNNVPLLAKLQWDRDDFENHDFGPFSSTCDNQCSKFFYLMVRLFLIQIQRHRFRSPSPLDRDLLKRNCGKGSR